MALRDSPTTHEGQAGRDATKTLKSRRDPATVPGTGINLNRTLRTGSCIRTLVYLQNAIDLTPGRGC
jgi:hypothetical protein